MLICYFDNLFVGKVVVCIMNDIEVVRDLYVMVLFMFIISGVYMFGIFMVLFMFDVRLVVVCFLIILILIIWLVVYCKYVFVFN